MGWFSDNPNLTELLKILGILVTGGGGTLLIKAKLDARKTNKAEIGDIVAPSTSIHQYQASGDVVVINSREHRKEEASPEPRLDPFELGYQLIAPFSRSQALMVGEKFGKIFEKAGSEKNGEKTVEAAIFALGSSGLRAPQWREQAASALRELLHDWKGGNGGSIATAFCDTFRGKYPKFPDSTDPQGQPFYQKMQRYYAFFTGVCHVDSQKLLIALRGLRGPEIQRGDCDDRMFIKIVAEFLQDLHSFFDEHL